MTRKITDAQREKFAITLENLIELYQDCDQHLRGAGLLWSDAGDDPKEGIERVTIETILEAEGERLFVLLFLIAAILEDRP